MNDFAEPLRLLLISYDSSKQGLLQRTVCAGLPTSTMTRVEPGPAALASATGRAGGSNPPLPHIILIDLETTDAAVIAVAKRLVTDTDRPPVPLVLLTSRDSEPELRNGRIPIDDSRTFEAVSLVGFARNLARHKPKRFLRALSILSKVGPVMVRIPDEQGLRVAEPAA